MSRARAISRSPKKYALKVPPIAAVEARLGSDGLLVVDLHAQEDREGHVTRYTLRPSGIAQWETP